MGGPEPITAYKHLEKDMGGKSSLKACTPKPGHRATGTPGELAPSEHPPPSWEWPRLSHEAGEEGTGHKWKCSCL